MQRIYIIKEKEISYDDQYYYFDVSNSCGNISDVYCLIDKAFKAAKAHAEGLYSEYSNQLDDIEWDRYSYSDEDERQLSTLEGKLNFLKRLCYKLITVEVYENPNLDGRLEYIKSISIDFTLPNVN